MVFLKKVLDAKNDTFHSKNKFFLKKRHTTILAQLKACSDLNF
jgi:hypothetical protein